MAKKKEGVTDDVTQPNLEMEDLDFGELEEAPAKKEKPKKEPPKPKPPKKETGDTADEVVGMSSDVPVKMTAVLGKKKMLLRDLLKLKVGQSINLERAPNEFVDLVANGKLVARGELVEIDGQLGVRIIKLLK